MMFFENPQRFLMDALHLARDAANRETVGVHGPEWA
jgi:hypothetical protein